MRVDRDVGRVAPQREAPVPEPPAKTGVTDPTDRMERIERRLDLVDAHTAEQAVAPEARKEAGQTEYRVDIARLPEGMVKHDTKTPPDGKLAS